MQDDKRSFRQKVALPSINLEQVISGKIPPQALDLEEAVLGALMLDRNAVNSVVDILKKESFYKDSHQIIYECIHDLFRETEPVDILTVTQRLRKKGKLEICGGAYYISQLTNRVASAANAEYHARIILQKAIQRDLIRVSTETIRDAFEDSKDVMDLLDEAEKNLFEIAESSLRKNFADMHTLVAVAIKEFEIAGKAQGGVTGVPSGFTELDKLTRGWQRSDLIIVAARPAMGKTAFVLSMARNAAVRFGKPVAFFSLEMSSAQLVSRLVSSEVEISGHKLRSGNLTQDEWSRLNTKVSDLTKAPIFIDDTPALTILELRAKARRLKAEKDIQMIIIDYLQLMGGDKSQNRNGNREQEISAISRSLKAIAKELDIPVIALSQLSRSVETRGGTKKPILSDLRESGAIEQDADLVLFLYRPEYYKNDQDEEGNSTRQLAEVIVAKNRNGSLQDINMKFLGEYTKFTDWEQVPNFNENYFPNSGSYDVSDESATSPMKPNVNAASGRVTMNSKMNSMDDEMLSD